MKAKSIKGKTAVEINTALEAAGTDGFMPTLAVIFISAEGEIDRIQKVFTERNISIFGSSTGSEFVDGAVETGTIVVLLLELDHSKFIVQLLDSGNATTLETVEEIGKFGLSKFSKPAFIIVSGGIRVDGDEIVNGIENACGKGTTLFGGLAADDNKMERTYVFTNDGFTEKGLVALIVDEAKVNISGIAVGGWRPIGIDRLITRSEGNVVYTIDNEPALDFIARYVGIKDIDVQSEIGFLVTTNFQLQLQRKDKHPVMRAPMQSNKLDRSVIFSAGLPQGSKVRLCLMPGFEVIDEAIGEFKAYKNSQSHADADAMLMFSCAGRQVSLGPYVSREIEGVHDIWNVPMAGFFCFGEIGRMASGNTEFHNMTCSLMLIKEH